MKKIILLIFISVSLYSQTFVVEKVSGDVYVLTNFSEEWTKVKPGQSLNGNDIISTGEKSFIQLNNKGSRFVLQSNSALSINNIKKISLNELLLALAMEEIRNVPDFKEKNSRRNTAVYGEKIERTSVAKDVISDLGIKKLNGAKQLASNGYKESAILLAKETYRKYPETKLKFDYRLYFADLMIGMGLFNESLSELNEMKSLMPNEIIVKNIDERIAAIKEKLISK